MKIGKYFIVGCDGNRIEDVTKALQGEFDRDGAKRVYTSNSLPLGFCFVRVEGATNRRVVGAIRSYRPEPQSAFF
jgi:hypothetical protein